MIRLVSPGTAATGQGFPAERRRRAGRAACQRRRSAVLQSRQPAGLRPGWLCLRAGGDIPARFAGAAGPRTAGTPRQTVPSPRVPPRSDLRRWWRGCLAVPAGRCRRTGWRRRPGRTRCGHRLGPGLRPWLPTCLPAPAAGRRRRLGRHRLQFPTEDELLYFRFASLPPSHRRPSRPAGTPGQWRRLAPGPSRRGLTGSAG